MEESNTDARSRSRTPTMSTDLSANPPTKEVQKTVGAGKGDKPWQRPRWWFPQVKGKSKGKGRGKGKPKGKNKGRPPWKGFKGKGKGSGKQK